MGIITLDIFNNDAFGVTTMLDPVKKMPTLPGFLGSLGLFGKEPAYTDTVGIAMEQGQHGLIKTTLRASPIEVAEPDAKNLRNFRIPRIAKGDKIRSAELRNVVPMPGKEMETVQGILARKQQKLKQDVEYTWEFHRLGALQGVLLDADGSVLVDYFDEWDIDEPDPLEIDFTVDGGELAEGFRNNVVRTLTRAAQSGTAVTNVIGLAGDEFWDKMIRNPEVRETYMHWEAAAALRNIGPFGTFTYGGVDWVNYKGSDDNTTIAIDPQEAVIFPKGVPGMFQHVMGPGESLEELGNEGQEVYPLIVRDKDRDMYVQPEIYSYPLHINTRPDLVLRAVVG